jgi:ATP phosphoribosyltransferase regulatory subunit
MNDDSSAADAELIACVIDCLKASGLSEFQIEIGEVEYFKGLIEEAGINPETEAKIRDYIQLKNFFGLQEYVKSLDIKQSLKEALTNFDKLFGGLEMLDKAASYTKSQTALNAIDRMRKVYTALSFYGYEGYIGFDLSMLNRYNYYTGIVFRGYTYGTGDAVVKGGRYNNLLSQFGKDAPSVGFAIFVDELMMALQRQHAFCEIDHKDALVLYAIKHQEHAIELGRKLRNQKIRTELVRKSSRHAIDEYITYGKQNHIDVIYCFLDEHTVRKICIADNTDTTLDYEAL